jgi:transcriptional regulator with XRE-family HTH domain
MVISDRLRAIREKKDLSQGDIEKRTGLLRGYVSRVENGHTAPSIETLEKMARALEVPMYQLFYDGEAPPRSLRSRKGSPPTATNGEAMVSQPTFCSACASFSPVSPMRTAS